MSLEKKQPNPHLDTNKEPTGETYILRLYVGGASPRSTEAIDKITQICETYFPGNYDLEVIDIYQQPEFAAQENIVVAPTLVRQLPKGLLRLIGNLTNTKLVLQRLGIAT